VLPTHTDNGNKKGSIVQPNVIVEVIAAYGVGILNGRGAMIAGSIKLKTRCSSLRLLADHVSFRLLKNLP
jgi:hypothetical protein